MYVAYFKKGLWFFILLSHIYKLHIYYNYISKVYRQEFLNTEILWCVFSHIWTKYGDLQSK